MLGFRTGAKRAFQLTARIDGIDHAFLFGNTRLSCSRSGLPLLLLATAGHIGKQGLSPSGY